MSGIETAREIMRTGFRTVDRATILYAESTPNTRETPD